jgi:hypothetical protein
VGTALVPGDQQPDIDELQGRDFGALALPVRVEGPVETRKLPARSSATRAIFVTSAEPVRLLHADTTRARAFIRANDQNVYFAFTREEAAGTDCWILKSTDQPLPVESAEEMWVRAVGTSTIVMCISENWTY